MYHLEDQITNLEKKVTLILLLKLINLTLQKTRKALWGNGMCVRED